MEDFAEKLVGSIQAKIIKDLQQIKLVDADYNARIKITPDVVLRAYEGIDEDRIIALVKQGIEDQIAKTIIGNLTTEVATDTKKMMGDATIREKLKQTVYPQILQALN